MAALEIRPVEDRDRAVVEAINLAAFAGVHESFADSLGPELNALVYPDWETSQHQDLLESTTDETSSLWVAETDGAVVGFVAVDIDPSAKVGELTLIAVHPDHQGQGIGTAMNYFALRLMRNAGMTLATVATGGDPAHAPARRSYEKAGFVGLPLVRYYKAL